MYFLLAVDCGEIKKAKGVDKNIVKNTIHNDIQVFHIVKKKMMKHKMKRIQSKLNKVGTYDTCKV